MKRCKKLISAIFSSVILLSLNSCGVAQSAVQIPMRMAQSLERTAGLRLQATEIPSAHQDAEFHLVEK